MDWRLHAFEIFFEFVLSGQLLTAVFQILQVLPRFLHLLIGWFSGKGLGTLMRQGQSTMPTSILRRLWSDSFFFLFFFSEALHSLRARMYAHSQGSRVIHAGTNDINVHACICWTHLREGTNETVLSLREHSLQSLKRKMIKSGNRAENVDSLSWWHKKQSK